MVRTLQDTSDGKYLLQSLLHLIVSNDTVHLAHSPNPSAAQAKTLFLFLSLTWHQILSVSPLRYIQHLAPSYYYQHYHFGFHQQHLKHKNIVTSSNASTLHCLFHGCQHDPNEVQVRSCDCYPQNTPIKLSISLRQKTKLLLNGLQALSNPASPISNPIFHYSLLMLFASATLTSLLFLENATSGPFTYYSLCLKTFPQIPT